MYIYKNMLKICTSLIHSINAKKCVSFFACFFILSCSRTFFTPNLVSRKKTPIHTQCQSLRFENQQLTPQELYKLLDCINAKKEIQPLVNFIHEIDPEDIQFFISKISETTSNFPYFFAQLFLLLNEHPNQVNGFLSNINSLIKNKELNLLAIHLVEKLVNYEKISDLLNTQSVTNFSSQITADNFRFALEKIKDFLISFSLKNLKEKFTKNFSDKGLKSLIYSILYISKHLEKIDSQKGLDLFSKFFPQKNLEASIQKWSSLMNFLFEKQGKTITDISRTIQKFSHPIQCLNNQITLSNPAIFFLNELILAPKHELPKYIQQTNKLQIGAFSLVCKLPPDISYHYRTLEVLSNSTVIYDFIDSVEILNNLSLTESIVNWFKLDDTSPMSLQSLLPFFTWITEIKAWPEVLGLIASLQQKDVKYLIELLKKIKLDDAFNPFIDYSFDSFFEIIRVTLQKSKIDITPTLKNLQILFDSTKEHFILDFSKDFLPKLFEKNFIIEHLIKNFKKPSFKESFLELLEFIADTSKAGLLDDLLLKGLSFFQTSFPLQTTPFHTLSNALSPFSLAHNLNTQNILLKKYHSLTFKPTCRINLTAQKKDVLESILECILPEQKDKNYKTYTTEAQKIIAFTQDLFKGTNIFKKHASLIKEDSLTPRYEQIYSLVDSLKSFTQIKTNKKSSLETTFELIKKIEAKNQTHLYSVFNKLQDVLSKGHIIPIVNEMRNLKPISSRIKESILISPLDQNFLNPHFSKILEEQAHNLDSSEKTLNIKELQENAKQRIVSWRLDKENNFMPPISWSSNPRSSNYLLKPIESILNIFVRKSSKKEYPVLNALLNFFQSISFHEPIEDGSLLNYLTVTKLKDWFIQRSIDYQVIPYYFEEDSYTKRALLVNTLDYLELVVINVDFIIGELNPSLSATLLKNIYQWIPPQLDKVFQWFGYSINPIETFSGMLRMLDMNFSLSFLERYAKAFKQASENPNAYVQAAEEIVQPAKKLQEDTPANHNFEIFIQDLEILSQIIGLPDSNETTQTWIQQAKIRFNEKQKDLSLKKHFDDKLFSFFMHRFIEHFASSRLKLQKRLFNLHQVFKTLYLNAPGFNMDILFSEKPDDQYSPPALQNCSINKDIGCYKDGIQVLANLFHELYEATPLRYRNPYVKEKNNLFLINHFVRLGALRNIGKLLQDIPADDPRLLNVFQFVIKLLQETPSASQKPYFQEIMILLLQDYQSSSCIEDSLLGMIFLSLLDFSDHTKKWLFNLSSLMWHIHLESQKKWIPIVLQNIIYVLKHDLPLLKKLFTKSFTPMPSLEKTTEVLLQILEKSLLQETHPENLFKGVAGVLTTLFKKGNSYDFLHTLLHLYFNCSQEMQKMSNPQLTSFIDNYFSQLMNQFLSQPLHPQTIEYWNDLLIQMLDFEKISDFIHHLNPQTMTLFLTEILKTYQDPKNKQTVQQFLNMISRALKTVS